MISSEGSNNFITRGSCPVIIVSTFATDFEMAKLAFAFDCIFFFKYDNFRAFEIGTPFKEWIRIHLDILEEFFIFLV